ncbi:Uncharacterized protein PFLU_1435 [Pseudomonas [fluorescens] SBW25]|uniref:Uncharacterized protein n=1 Tax=Pseudomonas fluorescens (strain SBW25) TaxID=216595 RepID=C3KDI0_PSEFS|nr:Uncharacterized protein PFLU_1435 [Pseudomonas fluorescens SBW25]
MMGKKLLHRLAGHPLCCLNQNHQFKYDWRVAYNLQETPCPARA